MGALRRRPEGRAVRYHSIFRPDLLQGQTILVTGGGSGIGRAVACELHSLGAHVVLAGRTQAKLENVAAELENVSWHVADIRREDSIQALFDQVLSSRGSLQGLVNNAGGQFFSPAEDISVRGWQAVLETNLNGTFLMCKEAYQRCMKEHGGAIVNIVAEMWRGFPGMAHTGAARAGVVNLTQTLAVEWAHAGVRVNAVAPGIIQSSGLDNYPEAIKPVIARAIQDTPAKRAGSESEVAAAVTFLLSPAAAYISGETLKVDGAGSLWRKSWDIPDHNGFPPYQGFT